MDALERFVIPSRLTQIRLYIRFKTAGSAGGTRIASSETM